MVSQQYNFIALSDCTHVQAGQALYWCQRLITFGADRIRVNKTFTRVYTKAKNVNEFCLKAGEKSILNPYPAWTESDLPLSPVYTGPTCGLTNTHKFSNMDKTPLIYLLLIYNVRWEQSNHRILKRTLTQYKMSDVTSIKPRNNKKIIFLLNLFIDSLFITMSEISLLLCCTIMPTTLHEYTTAHLNSNHAFFYNKALKIEMYFIIFQGRDGLMVKVSSSQPCGSNPTQVMTMIPHMTTVLVGSRKRTG